MSLRQSSIVYWLRQSTGDVPFDDEWLADSERDVLARLRFPKRRADWRIGRWTAKQAVTRALGAPDLAPCRVEIGARDSGAPEVRIDAMPAPIAISISHAGGYGLCTVAVAPRAGAIAAVGCDLERIMPETPRFLAGYLTDSERALVSSAPTADAAALATLLWSAKESALKASGTGLRTDPRTVRVVLCGDSPARRSAADDGTWRALQVARRDGRPAFDGWWRRAGEFVLVIVVAPPGADVPTAL